MGNAWDHDKIKGNLNELTNINTNGRDNDKIALSRATGSIWVQEYNNSTRLARSIPFIGDSISDDRLKTALVGLFREAKEVSRQGLQITGGFVTVGDIRQALAGLNRLATTYDGNRAKSASVQSILTDVREVLNAGVANPDREEYYEQFLATFSDHQIFSVKQADLIPMAVGGVCKAMCLDWIRRKLFLEIDSLAITDANAHHHAFGESLRGNGNLSGSDYPRMREQAMDHWMPIQNALEHLNRHGNSKHRFEFMKERFDGFDMEHAFLITHQDYRGKTYHQPLTDPKDDLNSLLKLCLQGHKKYGPRAGFVLGLNRRFIPNRGSRGHAIGFHFHPAEPPCRVHILDPGIAEWEFFYPAEEERLHQFWEMFLGLYGFDGDPFIRWDLDCYYAAE